MTIYWLEIMIEKVNLFQKVKSKKLNSSLLPSYILCGDWLHSSGNFFRLTST